MSKRPSRRIAAAMAAATVDGRTRLARHRRDIRADLAADAGGVDAMTSRELTLLDRCSALTLIASHLEDVLLSGDVPLAGDVGNRTLQDYIGTVGTLARTLRAVGLRPQRPEKRVELRDYLATARQNTAQDGQGAARSDFPPMPAAGTPTDDADDADAALCGEDDHEETDHDA